jgi:hypothetical protein
MPTQTLSAISQWDLPKIAAHDLIAGAGLTVWALGMCIIPEFFTSLIISTAGGFIVPAARGNVVGGVMAGLTSAMIPICVHLAHPFVQTTSQAANITQPATPAPLPPAPATVNFVLPNISRMTPIPQLEVGPPTIPPALSYHHKKLRPAFKRPTTNAGCPQPGGTR